MNKSNDSQKFPMVLRAEISDEQRITYGRRLAQLDEDLNTQIQEKRDTVAEFKERMGAIKTEAREVARTIRGGQERREVSCFYRFKWKDGIKELIRTDTDEVIERIAITAEERQTVMNLGDDAAGKAVADMVITENPRRLIELEEE